MEEKKVNIASWLQALGLQQYEQAFRDNDIDDEVLPELTAEDLRDIGVSRVGHRRKLLAAIAALRDEGRPETGGSAQGSDRCRSRAAAVDCDVL